jgi:hypothetical protein
MSTLSNMTGTINPDPPKLGGNRNMAPQVVIQSCPPVRFDAAFIERRMREHKELQTQLAREGTAEIIEEVVEAYEIVRRCRTTCRTKLRELAS